jgi:CubicO group peptidase (beta-lactamase class C family)
MPTHNIRTCATVLLATAGAWPLAAQQRAAATASAPPPSAAALTAIVDSVVKADLLGRGVPSASVAVVRGDETVVVRAWGKADVASGRAADASTVYAIGSTSKQFTAALVLKLVDRGVLTLGDSLGRHLSGIRPEWRAITIEQLLNHTSGLPRGGFVDMSRIEEDLSFDSIVERASRNAMASRPGTTYLYSNTGYVVLGAVVEKLYGKPYEAALRDEIARPLGLTSLRYCADAAPGSVATGYQHSASDRSLSAAPRLHPSQQLGASGICTTAADLATWNRALHGGRVLSAASYAAMITPSGVDKTYGLGLSVGRAPWGDPVIAHGGQEVSGFVSENAWYPADSLSVTILYNAFPRLPSGGTHPIAALALGRRPPVARNEAPPPAVAGTPANGITGDEARRRFVGEYRMGSSATFKVDVENGDFVLTTPSGEKSPMVHRSGATYAVGNDSGPTVTFLADDEGRVVGFLAQQSGAPDRRLRKIR